MGGAGDGVCKDRELWRLVGVGLANPDLENCFRESQIAAWISGGYPAGEDKDSLVWEERFYCAGDHG